MRMSLMKNRNLILIIVLFIGAALALAACSDARPPEEIVAERAQARWDALVERDFEAAWQFYTPGYRQQLPAADFAIQMKQRRIAWNEAGVQETECSAQEKRCNVRSVVQYQVPAQVPGVGKLKGRTGVEEIWLQIDGEWWYSADA